MQRILFLFILLFTSFTSNAQGYKINLPDQQITQLGQLIWKNEGQQKLIHLLKQDCGSCHGMTLKGGLGPALLPENLADKPDYILVGVIKFGRETLAMPAWDGILNTAEIEWLVAQLKEGIE